MAKFKIRVSDEADDETRRAIREPLVAYNDKRAGASGYRPLVVSIIDSQCAAIGGLWGHTAYGWLFTELLLVPENLRGQGLGKQLMQRAETEALARGCHAAWLDTFEFQAREFYERLGYSVFGQLEDYPAGFRRHFMMKKLQA